MFRKVRNDRPRPAGCIRGGNYYELNFVAALVVAVGELATHNLSTPARSAVTGVVVVVVFVIVFDGVVAAVMVVVVVVMITDVCLCFGVQCWESLKQCCGFRVILYMVSLLKHFCVSRRKQEEEGGDWRFPSAALLY